VQAPWGPTGVSGGNASILSTPLPGHASQPTWPLPLPHTPIQDSVFLPSPPRIVPSSGQAAVAAASVPEDSLGEAEISLERFASLLAPSLAAALRLEQLQLSNASSRASAASQATAAAQARSAARLVLSCARSMGDAAANTADDQAFVASLAELLPAATSVASAAAAVSHGPIDGPAMLMHARWEKQKEPDEESIDIGGGGLRAGPRSALAVVRLPSGSVTGTIIVSLSDAPASSTDTGAPNHACLDAAATLAALTEALLPLTAHAARGDALQEVSERALAHLGDARFATRRLAGKLGQAAAAAQASRAAAAAHATLVRFSLQQELAQLSALSPPRELTRSTNSPTLRVAERFLREVWKAITSAILPSLEAAEAAEAAELSEAIEMGTAASAWDREQSGSELHEEEKLSATGRTALHGVRAPVVRLGVLRGQTSLLWLEQGSDSRGTVTTASAPSVKPSGSEAASTLSTGARAMADSLGEVCLSSAQKSQVALESTDDATGHGPSSLLLSFPIVLSGSAVNNGLPMAVLQLVLPAGHARLSDRCCALLQPFCEDLCELVASAVANEAQHVAGRDLAQQLQQLRRDASACTRNGELHAFERTALSWLLDTETAKERGEPSSSSSSSNSPGGVLDAICSPSALAALSRAGISLQSLDSHLAKGVDTDSIARCEDWFRIDAANCRGDSVAEPTGEPAGEAQTMKKIDTSAASLRCLAVFKVSGSAGTIAAGVDVATAPPSETTVLTLRACLRRLTRWAVQLKTQGSALTQAHAAAAAADSTSHGLQRRCDAAEVAAGEATGNVCDVLTRWLARATRPLLHDLRADKATSSALSAVGDGRSAAKARPNMTPLCGSTLTTTATTTLVEAAAAAAALAPSVDPKLGAFWHSLAELANTLATRAGAQPVYCCVLALSAGRGMGAPRQEPIGQAVGSGFQVRVWDGSVGGSGSGHQGLSAAPEAAGAVKGRVVDFYGRPGLEEAMDDWQARTLALGSQEDDLAFRDSRTGRAVLPLVSHGDGDDGSDVIDLDWPAYQCLTRRAGQFCATATAGTAVATRWLPSELLVAGLPLSARQAWLSGVTGPRKSSRCGRQLQSWASWLGQSGDWGLCVRVVTADNSSEYVSGTLVHALQLLAQLAAPVNVAIASHGTAKIALESSMKSLARAEHRSTTLETQFKATLRLHRKVARVGTSLVKYPLSVLLPGTQRSNSSGRRRSIGSNVHIVSLPDLGEGAIVRCCHAVMTAVRRLFGSTGEAVLLRDASSRSASFRVLVGGNGLRWSTLDNPSTPGQLSAAPLGSVSRVEAAIASGKAVVAVPSALDNPPLYAPLDGEYDADQVHLLPSYLRYSFGSLALSSIPLHPGHVLSLGSSCRLVSLCLAFFTSFCLPICLSTHGIYDCMK
jgi:hypothetical protein